MIKSYNNHSVNSFAITVTVFAIIYITSLPVIGDSFREKMAKTLNW